MADEFVIRLKVPHRIRRRLVAIIGAGVLGSAALAFAMAPNTFNAGDPLSASRLNDSFKYLQGQITTTDLGVRTPSAFHASLTTATSSGTSAVAFDHVDFDLSGEYNKVTGAFITQAAGIYVINCNAAFTSMGTATTWSIQIMRNGSTLAIGEIQSSNSTMDSGAITPSSSTVVQLAAHDTITCIAGAIPTGGPVPLDTSSPARNTFGAARLY